MGNRGYRLETERLVLRPFTTTDAIDLQAIAGERRIVDTTISVPHPFSSADAADWIEKGRRGMLTGTAYGFAITLSAPEQLIGYAALHDVDTEHAQAEISFWVGAGFEGKGYVTEAARRLIDFAFDEIGLNRLCAFHMVRNRGSERVLEKLGFRQEGYLRQRVRKWGVFEDVLAWACSAASGRRRPLASPQGSGPSDLPVAIGSAHDTGADPASGRRRHRTVSLRKAPERLPARSVKRVGAGRSRHRSARRSASDAIAASSGAGVCSTLAMVIAPA